MTIKILGALGLLLLCVIFGAMGLMEAYKPYEDDEDE